MKKITLLFAIICSLSLFAEQKNGIVYVKAGATGTGASWTDALGDIQSAIALAKTDNLLRKDVWVAAGDYTITTCISLADSVNVYGSFAGTETAVSQRGKVAGGNAWEFTTPTTLHGSGARLIQVSSALDMATVVDGFVLTEGNGVGTVTSGSGGAALIRPNVMLQNCIVKNNTSTAAGGGVMMNTGGTISNCLIKNNIHTTGANGGGGIFCNTSTNGYIGYIENCVITGNTSTIRGAGIGVQGNSNTIITNNRIFNNSAIDAGTLKPGAGIFANSAFNVIKNNLIYNNTGTNAIYYAGGNLYNNTVVKNIGGIYLGASGLQVINNIVWACATDGTGTTPTSITGAVNALATVQNNATYNPIPTDKNYVTADNILFSSNVSNGDVTLPAAGTVGSGPKFNHVTRYYGAATTADELLQLDSVKWSIPMNSPCLNVGKTVSTVTTDITGLGRPQGYPAATALYDIGAYELPYYTVVAGDAPTANGAVYSALGVQLPENYSYGYVKGGVLELLFQSNAGFKMDRAYYTESTDGGSTFTGAETDFTSSIGTDGFWSTAINSSFKISVVWKSLTALSELSSDKIKCLVSGNGIELIGLSAGDKVSVYNVSGILVHQTQTNRNRVQISLDKGIYIVRVADSVKKIIIK